MNSLISVTFVLNSVFSYQYSPAEIVVTEYCAITIDGVSKGLVVGSCKDEGEMLVETWLERNPDKPYRLVVNGFDYNAS